MAAWVLKLFNSCAMQKVGLNNFWNLITMNRKNLVLEQNNLSEVKHFSNL